ncbi:unnamed protein product [Trichogramma brassicae]|uniref:Uncharacterized protein n=1 Tax=Trichogramma brassicae TaxID=86971 RepID=A0A6H5J4B8_9HYME|nr:unnamed protein product [Trichogramma brassicae]
MVAILCHCKQSSWNVSKELVLCLLRVWRLCINSRTSSGARDSLISVMQTLRICALFTHLDTIKRHCSQNRMRCWSQRLNTERTKKTKSFDGLAAGGTITKIYRTGQLGNRRKLREFLHQFDSVISDSKGQFLNLRDIFAREEIDRLLTVSATSEYADLQAYGAGKRFVEFVARSGYKDEPKVDEDGKPLLHRTTPLHDATRRLRFDLVRGLFDIYKRFDVNYTDHDGLTHFHAACVSGHVAVIEKFLEFGQDPDCLNVSLIVNPPLHLALQWGHGKAVKTLLRNGANPNLVFKSYTSLHVACNKRRDDLAVLLLKIAKEVDQVIQIDALDKKGRTPLHWALLNGKKQTTEALMRNGADTNLADAEGLTPLHYICRKGKGHNLLEMFFKINEELDKPVQIEVEDKKGRTPLHYALRNVSKKQIVRVLLRNAAKNSSLKLAYNQDRLTPLHIICLETNDDDVDLAKIFFEINDEFNQPWQVNAVGNDGNTPLHFALQNRRLGTKKTVELLLRRGIDPNSANAEGMTPLHFICQREEDDGFVGKILQDLRRHPEDGAATSRERCIAGRVLWTSESTAHNYIQSRYCCCRCSTSWRTARAAGASDNDNPIVTSVVLCRVAVAITQTRTVAGQRAAHRQRQSTYITNSAERRRRRRRMCPAASCIHAAKHKRPRAAAEATSYPANWPRQSSRVVIAVARRRPAEAARSLYHSELS